MQKDNANYPCNSLSNKGYQQITINGHVSWGGSRGENIQSKLETLAFDLKGVCYIGSLQVFDIWPCFDQRKIWVKYHFHFWHRSLTLLRGDAGVTTDNGKSKMTGTSNYQGINNDPLTLEQILQPYTYCRVHSAWPQSHVFLFVVWLCSPLCCHEICWEHFKSWRDEY